MLWKLIWCLDGESRRILTDYQREYYDSDFKLRIPEFGGGDNLPFEEEPDKDVVKMMTATPGQVRHWK